MPKLDSVTSADLQHATAFFDADMDLSTLAGGEQWSLASPAGAVAAQVTNAVPRDNSLRIVDLVIGPALAAGQAFTLTALNAQTAGGAALAPGDKAKAFNAPAVDGDLSEFPHQYLREITRGVGEALQTLAGRASTKLVAAFAADGGTAFVETTLGFPNSGAFFVGARKYRYTSKTPVSFLLCVPELVYPVDAAPEWSTVWCDPGAVELEE